MNNTEYLIEHIKELKDEIEHLEYEIDEIQSNIEDLEYNLGCAEQDLFEKQSDLSTLEQTLLSIQSPSEQQPYWIEMLLRGTDRNYLQGQFEKDGKWYICNGFVLIESKNKFKDIQEVVGMKFDVQKLLYSDNIKEVKIDIENIENVDIEEALKERYQAINIVENCHININYIIQVKNILQLNNESKFYITTRQSVRKTEEDTQSLICENENGRVLILGIRV